MKTDDNKMWRKFATWLDTTAATIIAQNKMVIHYGLVPVSRACEDCTQARGFIHQPIGIRRFVW